MSTLSRFGALWTVVAIACFWMLATCATASAAPGQIRVGKAPRRPAGARLVGALPGATRLPVSVTLEPRDPAVLAAHAAAVSTPGSVDYRHYLSVAGFSRRFGPTSGQIATIRSSLRAHGLRPGPVSANGLSIPVTATARAIERSFSTSLQRIALPGGRTAFTNTQAPLFDRRVAGAVQGVVGLDSLSAPQPLSLRRAAAAAQPRLAAHVGTGGPQPCASATTASQTGDATAYTADQIASAYGFSGLYGAGDEGAGQTIAVYELEPNIPSDITAYQQCYGTDASVSYVPVDGGPGHSHSGDGMETELDVESVIGLAPKANVVVYQGPNSSSNLPGSGPYDTYNAIISQDQANIVSTSWGACEADIGSASAQAENTLFQEAAVQGQTILAAAGDDGSEGCSTHDSLAIDDPGSQPFVTSAGGTSLSLSPSRSETVWNDRQGAGGGGISSLWPMPSYQSSASAWLNVAASSSSVCGASSGECREVPDVSTDADPLTGILTYYDGQWISLGGTSASAPTLAAMVALTDASSTCGGSSIGFANPALYASAAGSYAANFTDITTGNNDFTGTSGGLYPAGPGYDMASGLGSPNAASLAPALCEPEGTVTNPGSPVTATNPGSPVTATNPGSPVKVANPGSQTSLIGTRHSLQIEAAGGLGGPLTYTATGLPPGLMINSRSGLISGTVTRDGTYTVTVGAVDSEHSVGSTAFEWRIDPATVTIANPGAQTGRVGRYVSVQLGARANNAGSLTYTATGLPPGLALRSSSGLISGTPSAAVAGWVTVTATTVESPPARTRMRWTIGGNPRLSRSSLAAVAKGKPKLSLWFAAGTYAPLLKTISIAVPGQLAFTGKRRGLAVAANGAKRVVFTNKERKRLLVVTLRSAAPSFRITVGSPAIRAGRGLTSAVKHRRRQVLALTVTATDSSGLGTRFPLKLRPAS